ncbi:ABC transporter permease [Herbidospora sp. RD11066]
MGSYLLLAWTWARASAQYRTSFVVSIISSFAINALDAVSIGIVFLHVTTLGGFDFREVLFLYGTSGVSFAIADMLFGNIERLSQHIKAGSFDTMLIRPVSPFVQMAADGFGAHRIGRMAQAMIVLGLALPVVPWSRAWMVPVMILCGVVIFTAIFTLGAALQFVLVDAPEISNAFTYGGGTLTMYPLSVYGDQLVRGVTFIVPLAFVNWQPALYVLDQPDPLGLPAWLRFASPLAALLLAGLAALAWRTGIRRYQSTGN